MPRRRHVRRRGETSRRASRTCRSARARRPSPRRRRVPRRSRSTAPRRRRRPARASSASSAPGCVTGRHDRPPAQRLLDRRGHHALDTTSWASRAARRAIPVSVSVSPVSSIVSDTMMPDSSPARNVCSLSAVDVRADRQRAPRSELGQERPLDLDLATRLRRGRSRRARRRPHHRRCDIRPPRIPGRRPGRTPPDRGSRRSGR